MPSGAVAMPTEVLLPITCVPTLVSFDVVNCFILTYLFFYLVFSPLSSLGVMELFVGTWHPAEVNSLQQPKIICFIYEKLINNTGFYLDFVKVIDSGYSVLAGEHIRIFITMYLPKKPRRILIVESMLYHTA